jgi:nucleoside-diphosphate-sugar epimerase
MHILVTGWSGFIGRALLRRLVDRFGAASIVGLAREPANDAEAEAERWARAAGVRLIRADLCDSPPSPESLPPVDLVFHLAANIDTNAPPEQMTVNDTGTTHLLEWAAASLRGARVVYTSSVAVMDRNRPASAPLDENGPCMPRTHYGRSKLRGEDIIRSAARHYGFTYTIVRLPTVYGPGQKPGGMFDLLARFVAEEALPSRLDWPGRTSIIFIDDLARALVSLALSPAAADQLICVAADSPTVGGLTQAIAHALGKSRRVFPVPRWMWRLLRRAVWLPGLPRLVPAKASVSFWRLSLIVDDGFWFDDRKFRLLFPEGLTPLEEGLRRTFR